MGLEELRNALQRTSVVELTVTGRRSGRESTRPVWFVEESEKLFLLPVGGSDSNWYKNLVKTPAIGLAADAAEFRTDAKPIEDAAAVDGVVERFRARYGADQVKAYYPKLDAAVEVPLTRARPA
jgi:deazaflavin-dependent oxidoreductase (nitroreductase family)